jgi:hypothetical protein
VDDAYIVIVISGYVPESTDPQVQRADAGVELLADVHLLGLGPVLRAPRG